jgi:hypothetical protein
LRIWANYLGVQGDKEFVKLFEETVQDKALFQVVGARAFSLVHYYVGAMGMQGWEIVSINHMAIFYQLEYSNVIVPDFYLKKMVE